VTRVELYAVPMIVPECDGELRRWTVSVRETGEGYSAACDQSITLSVLQPYQTYTLQITGYSADAPCWSGTCLVTPLPGLDTAECPNTVIDACADAGADAGAP
jgi:hypothetical protein